MARFEIKCGKCRKALILSHTRDIHANEQDVFVEPCECSAKTVEGLAAEDVLSTQLKHAGNTVTDLRGKLHDMTVAKEMYKGKYNRTRTQLVRIMDNMPE